MKKLSAYIIALVITACFSGCNKSSQEITRLEEQFKNPPNEYRAYAANNRIISGQDPTGNLNITFNTKGFGGFMISPKGDEQGGMSILGPTSKHVNEGLAKSRPATQSPWVMIAPEGKQGDIMSATSAMDTAAMNRFRKQMAKYRVKEQSLGYLTPEWFDYTREILKYTKETGHKAVFYDEVGFPSGMANRTTPKELYRKLLEKSEEIVKGPLKYKMQLPEKGVLMAVVAMNISNYHRIDLSSFVNAGKLQWEVPVGNWRIMTFNCVISEAAGGSSDYNAVTDFLDPEAVQWYINTVYEPLYKELGSYFGNTINQSFFDDVGIWNQETTWSFNFNAKFKELTGKEAAIYYPALWYNIGSETEAARVAFFKTRAELLADGFPKILTDWGNKHNLPVSGHAPGQYEPQPTDMVADPFKFYRAQPIPMADVIHPYPFGRDGFKLISDGGDFYDKPVVAAETFSVFTPGGKKEGYRRAMELYIRGINRFIGADLGSPFSSDPIIGDSTTYAEWTGRLSLFMQGGQRVSEIAIFYPIDELQAFYHFDAEDWPYDIRWGEWVPYHADYLAVGEMLLNQVHRDFTFVHPDFLLSEKMKVNGKSLDLVNKVNAQSYKVLILPGEKVISIKALEKIKSYYDAGGAVIATSLLPSKASELPSNAQEAIANDKKVQAIIKEIIGIDSDKPMPEGVTDVKTNTKNGKSVFINTPSPELLTQVLDKMGISADVVFEGNPAPSTGGGAFSFVHKVKEGMNIYLMANSTDDEVNTYAELRGKIKPEIWDPYTGETSTIQDVKYIKKQGQVYTRVALKLDRVKSIFIVGK